MSSVKNKAVKFKDVLNLKLKSKNELTEIFFHALKFRNKSIINLCLKNNVDHDSSLLNQETILYLAAENGLPRIVERLIKRDGIDINTTNAGEYTPLIIAIINNYTDIVMILIQNGANINLGKKFGRSPLHWAVFMQRYHQCIILLEAGADPNIFDDSGFTPLFFASVTDNNLQLTKLLLKYNANPNISMPYQLSAFLEMCLLTELKVHAQILKLFLSKIKDVNMSEPFFKRTALHMVAINNNQLVAKMLLSRGANREARDLCNRRPIDLARLFGNDEVALMLERYIPPRKQHASREIMK